LIPSLNPRVEPSCVNGGRRSIYAGQSRSRGQNVLPEHAPDLVIAALRDFLS